MSPEITRDGKTRHASLPVDVRWKWCVGWPLKGVTCLVLVTPFLPA